MHSRRLDFATSHHGHLARQRVFLWVGNVIRRIVVILNIRLFRWLLHFELDDQPRSSSFTHHYWSANVATEEGIADGVEDKAVEVGLGRCLELQLEPPRRRERSVRRRHGQIGYLYRLDYDFVEFGIT